MGEANVGVRRGQDQQRRGQDQRGRPRWISVKNGDHTEVQNRKGTESGLIWLIWAQVQIWSWFTQGLCHQFSMVFMVFTMSLNKSKLTRASCTFETGLAPILVASAPTLWYHHLATATVRIVTFIQVQVYFVKVSLFQIHFVRFTFPSLQLSDIFLSKLPNKQCPGKAGFWY